MKDFLSKTAMLNRSIVSDDFDKTLEIVNERIPLSIHKYPTGSKCFDWILPKKWILHDAFILDQNGDKVLDSKNNPLHVVIGSLPINKKITRKELFEKIYISEEFPEAIPFQFKFYELDWGFCMSKKERDMLIGESFKVCIDTEYVDGSLTVGECVIPGKHKESIVILSHIDHPAQVNDGLAGAAVMIRLAEELIGSTPEFTLQFQFLPERIGSIAYLANNYKHIDSILGGIFCEMPGTPNYPLALQYSKWGDTRLDRIAEFVVKNSDAHSVFSDCFTHVVNDDGFYNSPGIDIPCISLSRSKPLQDDYLYHFPYYHTSGDNLEHFDFTQAEGFLSVLRDIITVLNKDRIVHRKYIGVPNLSRHGLWVDWRIKPGLSRHIDAILNNIDNHSSIFDIAQKCEIDFELVYEFLQKLADCDLVEFSSVKTSWYNPKNSFSLLASRTA